MAGYIGARSVSLSATVANAQDVTATDTTPEVTIINNTHEDTDGGREGKVIFKGQQSGGEESTLAEIQGSHDGASDDEKGDLIFKTNDGSDDASPTERMRIDSDGHVGIGTSTVGRRLTVKSNASVTIANFESTSSVSGLVSFSDANTTNDVQVRVGALGDNLILQSGGVERMRSNSSGDVFFGTASNSYPTNNNFVHVNEVSGVNMIVGGHSGTHTVLQFRHNGATTVGSIVVDGSSTTYNTSSDYRLKENVTDISDGITRVKQLKPKRFNFIADADTTVDGFLAHEAATVIPEAVTGTKDGLEVWKEKEKDELPDGVSVGDNKLDEDGNTIPEYQGIDQAKIVPLLTAALQEAIGKIETLETKVAALEAE